MGRNYEPDCVAKKPHIVSFKSVFIHDDSHKRQTQQYGELQ